MSGSLRATAAARQRPSSHAAPWTRMPAHWVVYFSVAETDAAVTAAEAGGGTVIAPAFDTPYGRMAGITDPAGAMFWVVQDTGQAGSDQPE